jgi:predicted MFS family arabinose efflux permease
MTSSSVPEAAPKPPWRVVWALSVTQIVGWGTIYYGIALLMPPIEAELGWSRDAVSLAYALGLLVAGFAALPVGLVIDRLGGRGAMTLGSVLGGLLFALLGQVESYPAFVAIWLGLGVAMALVLYEAAFIVITMAFGSEYRKGITVCTFAGGLASSIFWPITDALLAQAGWRDTALVLGLANVLICGPLHFFALPGARAVKSAPTPAGDSGTKTTLGELARLRSFWLLALSFTAYGFVASALSVHQIPMLRELGVEDRAAVVFASLVGVMQVVGRLIEFFFAKRFTAAQVGLAMTALMPAAMLALWFAGTNGLMLFLYVTAYGVANGIITIVRGAIPVELYGRSGYGAISGALSAPSVLARALGPWIAALVWTSFGGYAAVILTLFGIGLVGFLAFAGAVGGRRR